MVEDDAVEAGDGEKTVPAGGGVSGGAVGAGGKLGIGELARGLELRVGRVDEVTEGSGLGRGSVTT